MLASYGWIPAPRAAEHAAQIAGCALRTEPDLASPHATFGFIRSLFDHRWLEAARDFEESIRRDPRYSTAHHWYALLLAATNDLKSALAHVEIASECDRDSRVIDVHKAAILYWSQRYEAAEKQCVETLGYYPRWWYASHLLGLIYAEQGRLDDALEKQLDAIAYLPDESPMLIATLARTHALRGSRAEAIGALERRKAYRADDTSFFHTATAYAALGEFDTAFEYLDRACQQRDVWVSFLDVDPRLDSLRADPRFGRLREQLNLL
jgi:tetratricopeptide (TPR) repeat protein